MDGETMIQSLKISRLELHCGTLQQTVALREGEVGAMSDCLSSILRMVASFVADVKAELALASSPKKPGTPTGAAAVQGSSSSVFGPSSADVSVPPLQSSSIFQEFSNAPLDQRAESAVIATHHVTETLRSLFPYLLRCVRGSMVSLDNIGVASTSTRTSPHADQLMSGLPSSSSSPTAAADRTTATALPRALSRSTSPPPSSTTATTPAAAVLADEQIRTIFENIEYDRRMKLFVRLHYDAMRAAMYHVCGSSTSLSSSTSVRGVTEPCQQRRQQDLRGVEGQQHNNTPQTDSHPRLDATLSPVEWPASEPFHAVQSPSSPLHTNAISDTYHQSYNNNHGQYSIPPPLAYHQQQHALRHDTDTAHHLNDPVYNNRQQPQRYYPPTAATGGEEESQSDVEPPIASVNASSESLTPPHHHLQHLHRPHRQQQYDATDRTRGGAGHHHERSPKRHRASSSSEAALANHRSGGGGNRWNQEHLHQQVEDDEDTGSVSSLSNSIASPISDNGSGASIATHEDGLGSTAHASTMPPSPRNGRSSPSKRREAHSPGAIREHRHHNTSSGGTTAEYYEPRNVVFGFDVAECNEILHDEDPFMEQRTLRIVALHPHGPADAGGLCVGDRIEMIDSYRVSSLRDLQHVSHELRFLPPGTPAAVHVSRGARRRTTLRFVFVPEERGAHTHNASSDLQQDDGAIHQEHTRDTDDVLLEAARRGHHSTPMHRGAVKTPTRTTTSPSPTRRSLVDAQTTSDMPHHSHRVESPSAVGRLRSPVRRDLLGTYDVRPSPSRTVSNSGRSSPRSSIGVPDASEQRPHAQADSGMATRLHQTLERLKEFQKRREEIEAEKITLRFAHSNHNNHQQNLSSNSSVRGGGGPGSALSSRSTSSLHHQQQSSYYHQQQGEGGTDAADTFPVDVAAFNRAQHQQAQHRRRGASTSPHGQRVRSPQPGERTLSPTTHRNLVWR